MVTEMAMMWVPPCRALLYLDRLTDRGPVRHLHLECGLRLWQLALPSPSWLSGGRKTWSSTRKNGHGHALSPWQWMENGGKGKTREDASLPPPESPFYSQARKAKD